MTEKFYRLLLVACVFAVGSATTAAAVPTVPLINSATYDTVTQVLTLSGENLTESSLTPAVEFNSAPLTVIGATPTQITAYLPNATLPGSYLIVVHTGAQKNDVAQFDVTIGAAGPQGAQGLPGLQGPQGPKGDMGVLASFNDVNGLPCSVAGTAATMVVSFASNGVATLTCNLPPPPVPPDGFNNTFGNPVQLGIINCGQSTVRNGTTAPAGTEDWFVFNWPGQCGRNAFGFPIPGGTAVVNLTSSDPILFDIRTDFATNVVSRVTSSFQTSTPGTYYIRIYGATSAVTGTWAMTVFVNP
jgi:hypothetical protein